MKVLYTNFHDGVGGGHATYLRELCRHLSPLLHVHVASPSGSQVLEEAAAMPGVRVHAQTFPNGLRSVGQWWQARRRFTRFLREQRFDIIHVNGSADHRLVMACLSGLSPRPRVVMTKHNLKSLRGMRHHLRARLATDKVIAVSDYVREMVSRSPYHLCAPQTVHNGVDTDVFTPWAEGLAVQSRLDWGCLAGQLLLGSAAGTADCKGWTDWIPAMQRLSYSERLPIRILVAGLPPSAEQRERVSRAGLDEHFIFPGLVADVRPLIASVDVGFVLSRQEALSFACREMMAMGKPVLATRVGGLPENLRDGEDGWLVEPGDIGALTSALRWMLSHRAWLPTMGTAARQHALQAFALEPFVQATLGVYQDVLARPQSV